MIRRVSAALLLSSLAIPVALVGATPDWREVQRNRFVLRGRIAEGQIQKLACELEQVAELVDEGYGSAVTRDVASVIAVTGERDLRQLMPQFWEQPGARPLGGYWFRTFGHHIVIRVDVPRRERLGRMLHEYAHFASHLAYTEPSPWFDEGLSELWGNALVEDRQVVVGRGVPSHLKRLRSDGHWIPLKELTAATALPPATDREQLLQFYAESWAVVHYLVFERNARSLVFAKAPDAPSIPSDMALQHYIRQAMLPVINLPSQVGGDCRTAKAHDVSRLDAMRLQARALADGPRPESALPLLRKLAATVPNDPQTLEITAVVRFSANDLQGAAVLFDRVIAAGQASHISYYYRAVLAEAIPARTDGQGPIPVADYLKEALRRAPEFGPARERLSGLSEPVSH